MNCDTCFACLRFSSFYYMQIINVPLNLASLRLWIELWLALGSGLCLVLGYRVTIPAGTLTINLNLSQIQ